MHWYVCICCPFLRPLSVTKRNQKETMAAKEIKKVIVVSFTYLQCNNLPSNKKGVLQKKSRIHKMLRVLVSIVKC